jgi:hypothetical protein
MSERHGSEKADYPIRSFLSEGFLKLQTTIKNPNTGEFEKMEKEIEGPVGIIETTTSPRIHQENETRMLNIFTDQSEEQTNRILDRIDSDYTKPKQDDCNYAVWQNAQLILNKFPVHIPFAKSISNNMDAKIKKKLRIRRDYQKLLAVIEASAILHQYQRVRKEADGKQYIEADIADYYIAKTIIEKSFSKTLLEIPEQTKRIIDLAISLNSPFTIKDIAKKTKGNRTTIDKWLKPALNEDYILIEDEGKGNTPTKYRLNPEKNYEEVEIFPDIKIILSENTNEFRSEKIYNPLTGEKISTSELCCHDSAQDNEEKNTCFFSDTSASNRDNNEMPDKNQENKLKYPPILMTPNIKKFLNNEKYDWESCTNQEMTTIIALGIGGEHIVDIHDEKNDNKHLTTNK